MVVLSQAQDVRTTLTIEEPQVREMVITEGYDDPITIEREENLWRVKSTESGSNEEIVLFVDNDGNVLSASEVTTMRISQDASGFEETDQHEIEILNESSVVTVVMNAGFHNVHDIDFLDGRGVWKAEADDISGEDYELHVNPENGNIVHIEDD
ncbi:MAG: hypothetical protein KDA77_17720 [Planctomycetaceae bacterium]|nr:hypothetical protein [Planctomycetaceae bacterium]